MKELNIFPTNICGGGGVRESTLQKLQRLEDKCSPSYEGWCQTR